MSDETPPPSLRLKPRQRPEGETPPPAPAAPGAPPEPEGGKIRLKPKLTAQPASETVATPEPEPAPSAERFKLKPKLSPQPEAAAESGAPPELPAENEAAAEAPPAPPAPEEPKIKLKIKVPGAAIEAAAADEPEEDAEKSPPPFPVMVPPLSEGGAPPPAGPTVLLRPNVPRPGVRRPGPPGRRIPPSALAAATRRRKVLKLLLVGLLSIGLAASILAIAKFKFINPPPPPSTRIPPPRPVVTAPPEVVTPPPETEVAKVPEPVERPDAHVVKPRPRSGETSSNATTDLAPGVTVTTQAVEAEVEASQSFRTFVADAKISGVFQGSPSRAFINGRLIRAGETVDAGLAIRFETVDPATKTIIFKDSSGASVSRRY
ncbi:MAG: hypothetical protein JWM32_2485 [Verrucomicrobia bacterium]|nr:hypothetical protein [Verrucomicrobiota bacterium]